MKYLINAYENLYGGLHGMNDIYVGDFYNKAAAKEAAECSSRDVIEFYGSIYEDLEESAREFAEDEGTSFEEVFEEVIEEDICYEVILLNDEAQTKSAFDLDEELADIGYDEFLEKYGCKN